jgi:hypothetical protein
MVLLLCSTDRREVGLALAIVTVGAVPSLWALASSSLTRMIFGAQFGRYLIDARSITPAILMGVNSPPFDLASWVEPWIASPGRQQE